MIKRKSLIIIAIMGSLIFVGLSASACYPQQIPGSPEQLLLRNERFPREWAAKIVPEGPVNWQIYMTSASKHPDAIYHATLEAFREWRHNNGEDNGLRITQRVVCYDNNAEAMLYYQIANPEITYDQWPYYNHIDVRRLYQRSVAHQEQFICAMGGGTACQIWYYSNPI